ncbi:YceI family protein [Chitinophaga lutea]
MRIYAALPIVFVLAVSCQQAPKADKAEVTDAQAVAKPAASAHTLTLDTAASYVQWIGTKPTGEHHGSFRFSGGELYVKDSALTGGHCTIDINSLRNLDLETQPDMRKKLEDELRGANFFDAARYPTASFEITDVAPYKPAPTDEEVLLKDATHMIKGNLTMKETVKNITFPAKIVLDSGRVKATANFNIDRTLWGMTYRADKSLQDKLIRPAVNIQLEITTR